jgi:subtilisin family serine protease
MFDAFQITQQRRTLRECRIEWFEPRDALAADAPAAAVALQSTGASDALDLSAAADARANSVVEFASPNAQTASQSSNHYGLSGAGQTVVIIDSGIAYDHAALGAGIGAGRHIVGGWDFAENDADPYDDGPLGAHGTHVAGIIGSLDDRYPGLAPGADIVSLRVFDDDGRGDFQRIESALQWVHVNRFAYRNPITTINLSVGARWNADDAPQWSIIEDELAQLEADGIFISVAAGNSFVTNGRQPGLSYPASSSHVVPVGSVDANGLLSDFSQRSSRMIAAPGRSVVSTVPDYAGNFNYRADDFLVLTGTSMAAPQVAAASMLVREALARVGRAHVTQNDIFDLLRQNADTMVDSVTSLSYARMNLDRTLAAILGTATPPEATVPVTTPATPPTTSPPTPAPPDTTPPVTAPPAAPGSIDWGRVDFGVFRNQSFATTPTRQVTAANAGLLTIELVDPPADATIELYDAKNQLIAAAGVSAGGLRIDAPVLSGQTVRFKLNHVGIADVRITNLVSRDGSAVYVLGTTQADAFAFTAGATYGVTINGTSYTYAVAGISRIYLVGAGGNDTATVTGTAGYEVAALRQGKASLRGAGFFIVARDIATVDIDGAGGGDVAYFTDTSGDDRLSTSSDRAQLSGDGYRLAALDFAAVRARATTGNDTAVLSVAANSPYLSRDSNTTRYISNEQLQEITNFDVITLGSQTSIQEWTTTKTPSQGAPAVFEDLTFAGDVDRFAEAPASPSAVATDAVFASQSGKRQSASALRRASRGDSHYVALVAAIDQVSRDADFASSLGVASRKAAVAAVDSGIVPAEHVDAFFDAFFDAAYSAT